ncbi:MAG: hypothetical protein R3F20_06465 [Planctomycetota bacterium]
MRERSEREGERRGGRAVRFLAVLFALLASVIGACDRGGKEGATPGKAASATSGAAPVAAPLIAEITPGPAESGPRLTVTVLDRAGRPAVGAEVAVWPTMTRPELDRLRAAFALAPAARRTTARSDEGGRAVLRGLAPGPYEGVALGEGDAGFFRAEIGDAAATDARVELEAVRCFEVTLSDPAGAPIPDALVALSDPDAWPRGEEAPGLATLDLLPHGLTDARGHLLILAPDSPSDWSLSLAERVDVILPRFGGEKLVRGFTLDPGPVDIALTVSRPAALDLKGSPSDAGGRWALIASGREGWIAVDAQVGFEFDRRPRRWRRIAGLVSDAWFLRLPPGGLRLAAFAPGGQASIHAGRPDGRLSHDVLVLPPNGPDEYVFEPRTEAQDESAPAPRLHLRLRRPDGMPLPLEDGLRFHLATRDGEIALRDIHSGEEGVIEIALPEERAGTLILHREGGASDDPADRVEVTRLAIPALKSGEVREILDAGTPPPTDLVLGRVIDDTGAPVAGARVSATEILAAPAGDAGAEAPFREAAYSAADGRFALRGYLGEGRSFDLEGQASGHETKRRSGVPMGMRDLEIVLPRCGEIRGSILLPDRRLLRDLEVLVSRAGDPTAVTARIRSGGSFASPPLDPGTYDVRILLAGSEVARAGLIQVVPGESSRPSALDELAVARDLAYRDVHVADRQGRPLAEATVVATTPGSESRPQSAVTDEGGRARLRAAPGETFDLQVLPPTGASARRMMPGRFRWMELPCTVELDAMPRHEFSFAGEIPEVRDVTWRLNLHVPGTSETKDWIADDPWTGGSGGIGFDLEFSSPEESLDVYLQAVIERWGANRTRESLGRVKIASIRGPFDRDSRHRLILDEYRRRELWGVLRTR